MRLRRHRRLMRENPGSATIVKDLDMSGYIVMTGWTTLRKEEPTPKRIQCSNDEHPRAQTREARKQKVITPGETEKVGAALP